MHITTQHTHCQALFSKIIIKIGVDKCGKRWYYNSITCVRGHSWDRLEGEKNVKGLQAGRNLTWEHPKNIQQNQWLTWTNWEEQKSNPASKPLHNSNTPPKTVPNPSPLTVKILYPSRPQSHKPSNFQRFPGRGAHQKCQWYQWHTGDS